MSERTDTVWQSSALASVFLEGVRAAIPLAGEQIDMMLRVIAAAGRPIRRVLDLGCGDGILGAAILARFPESEAVLSDFSEPMLDAARKRVTERAHYICADYGVAAWVEAVRPWAPFDAIVSGFSIHHQPDARKREVYGEIYRLLADGGIFVNVEHVASSSEWLGQVHNDLFIDSLHRYHPGKTREEVAAVYYDRSDKSSNILAPVEAQCEWLRQAGFTDVDCYLKCLELVVFGGRRL